MNAHSSSSEMDSLLEAKRQLALRAVERLLTVCGEHESPLWLSRFQGILEALRQGRLRDAIAAECRVAHSSGVKYGPPIWVVSEKMAMDVNDAISRIRTHVYFEDDSDVGKLPVRPTDVTFRGTVKRRDERAEKRDEARFRIVVDPIESDPQFTSLLEAVNEMAEANLSAQGIERQLGYCNSFWGEKRRILREEYGIEWQSPADLNPGVLFD